MVDIKSGGSRNSGKRVISFGAARGNHERGDRRPLATRLLLQDQVWIICHQVGGHRLFKLSHFGARVKMPSIPSLATGVSSATKKDVDLVPKIKTTSSMSKTLSEDTSALSSACVVPLRLNHQQRR